MGGVQKGNGTAACLVAMNANQRTNDDSVAMKINKPLTGSLGNGGLGMSTQGQTNAHENGILHV